MTVQVHKRSNQSLLYFFHESIKQFVALPSGTIGGGTLQEASVRFVLMLVYEYSYTI